jgi:hypothetical protein
MTVRVDGRALRQITQTRAQPRTPAGQADIVRDWSRDGRWVLFERSWSVEAFAASLYAVHPDGTGFRQLASSNGETGVRFGSASFEP